jgi:iron complex outermembrane receptor protein
VSGEDGRFVVRGVPAGTYALSVSLVGYRPASLRGVRVNPGRATEVIVRLAPSAVEMPGVVVTATKRAQGFEEAPVSVSVLGGAEIAARNATTLDEVLGVAPGVHLVGGQVNVRGSSGYSRGTGSRVLVLVDGFPALSADVADVKWDAIPVAQVDRVEVVKGAGSALYGTGALGGVINVLTKTPGETPETTVNALGGVYTDPHYPSWKWTDRRLYFSGVDGSHSRSARALRLLVAGARRYSTGFKENGRSSKYSGFGKFQYLFSPKTVATLILNGASEDHDVTIQWKDRNQPLEVPDGAVGDKTLSRKLNVNAQVDHLGPGRAATRLRASLFRTWFDNDLEGRQAGSRAVKGWGEAQTEFRVSQRVTLTQGAEATVDRVSSAPSLFGDRMSKNFGVYAQGDVEAWPALTLSAGARYDRSRRDDGRIEDQVSPRLGLALRVSPRTTVRASLGRGFRAPSISEVYTNSTFAGVPIRPNPDLRAESSLTAEVGVARDFGAGVALDGAVFVSRYRDLIEARPDETQTVRFQNVSRGRIAGAEVSLQADWRRAVRLTANATYLDAVEAFSGGGSLPLPYRPRWVANATLTFRRWGGRAGGEFRYASRIRRGSALFPEGSRDLIPVYLVDAFAGVEAGRVSAQLRVRNLLQYHYAEHERSLGEIRNVSLSVSGKF